MKPQSKPSPSLIALLDHVDNLWGTFDLAFKRVFEPQHAVDHVVFFYGRRSIEDFSEILVLCQQGYHSGANSLLRGMYERAVTAAFLSQHPDEASNFLDFYWIAQRRLSSQIRETLGEELLSEETLRDVENKYQSVKGKFTVTACEKCKKTKVNHTWSKLDFVSMAKQIGPLGSLVVPAYALPTQEAHATVRAILDHVTTNEDGVLIFNGTPDTATIDRVLMCAHNVVLTMLDLQKEHFKLDTLNEPLQECLRQFKVIWPPKTPATQS